LQEIFEYEKTAFRGQFLSINAEAFDQLIVSERDKDMSRVLIFL
jgi:hypothetical protein